MEIKCTIMRVHSALQTGLGKTGGGHVCFSRIVEPCTRQEFLLHRRVGMFTVGTTYPLLCPTATCDRAAPVNPHLLGTGNSIVGCNFILCYGAVLLMSCCSALEDIVLWYRSPAQLEARDPHLPSKLTPSLYMKCKCKMYVCSTLGRHSSTASNGHGQVSPTSLASRPLSPRGGRP